MKRTISLRICACSAACMHGLWIAPVASAQSGPGWVTLVDGKTMGDWNTIGEANWRIEDGALVADKGKAAHLVSKNSYKNFQIYAEFWSDDDANSGIFIRCADPKKIDAKTCYEVNIFDKRPDPSYGTGSIVNFAEVNPMPKAGGKWNTFEITAKGRKITVMMNGQKTVDLNNGMFEEGHVHAAVRRRRHQVAQGRDQAVVSDTGATRSVTLPWRGRVDASDCERRGGVTLYVKSHPTPPFLRFASEGRPSPSRGG